MNYKIFYSLMFSLLLISCDMETVIELDVPEHKPVLVLNGLLDTDTTTQVVISHSIDAFSNGVPSFIHDANVLLYKNDELIGFLLPDTENLIYVEYTDDNYTSKYVPMYYYKNEHIPEQNATYRIEVNHPNYPPISSETYIPDDIILYNIDVDTISNAEKIGFTFSFDDNANQQNYYRLRLYGSCEKNYEKDDELDRGYLVMKSNDPSFPGDIPWDGYTFIGDNVIFTDDLFDGQSKTITLDVDAKFSYADCDTIIIEFSTFSDNTYSYYNSLGEHVEKGELGLFGGEVIPVYSNVENGLGALISVNSQNIYLKPQFQLQNILSK